MKVEERVIFTGWLEKEDLWKIYLDSDLFVLTSLNEGMPNVMLEALGCDLPSLGSKIPGIEDILQYEELMFDPLNEKEVVEKITRVFSDPSFFDRIRRLCIERKEHFMFNWKERIFDMATSACKPQKAR